MRSLSLKADLRLLSLLACSLHVYAAPVLDPLVARSLSCTNNASNGTTYNTASHSYEIDCATDYYRGDLSSTTASSFEDCLAACDSATGCIAVAYVSGSCYLKNQLNAPYTNNAVWGAKRIDASRSAISCVNNKGNGTTYQSGGQSYTVLCGYDNYGGDLSYLTTSTFELCIAACSSTSGCIDVSYTEGNCYLKSALTSWTKNYYVNTAVLTSAQQGVSPDPTCANNQDDGKQYTATTGAVFDI